MVPAIELSGITLSTPPSLMAAWYCRYGLR
jgi:hypothetical protein